MKTFLNTSSLKLSVAIPTVIENNIEQNYQTMLKYLTKAHNEGVGLIMFPETVLTGIDITDDFETDKKLAITLDSDYIKNLQEKAIEYNLWIAFGFFEFANNTIFDSVILINSKGELALHYKRISRGWCHPDANPREYGSGDSYPVLMSPWGKIGFLVCGDLFDVPELAIKEELDVLLFPFARCFCEDIISLQEEWDNVEWEEYANQIKSINAYTLMANYIIHSETHRDDFQSSSRSYNNYFGGGFITDRKGNIIASLPLNQEGLLIWDGDIKK